MLRTDVLLQVLEKTWWPGTELNRRRQPFQGLPQYRLSGSKLLTQNSIGSRCRVIVWDVLG